MQLDLVRHHDETTNVTVSDDEVERIVRAAIALLDDYERTTVAAAGAWRGGYGAWRDFEAAVRPVHGRVRIHGLGSEDLPDDFARERLVGNSTGG